MTSHENIDSRRHLFLLAIALLTGSVGCNITTTTSSSTVSTKTAAAYCPYLPSLSFSPAITVSGKACYQYRENGNGKVTDGVEFDVGTPVTAGKTYTVTFGATAKTFTATVTSTVSDVVNGLIAVINADASLGVTASSGSSISQTTALFIKSNDGCSKFVYNNVVNLTAIDHWPKPVRFAEVRVTDSGGNIVQCAETDGTGAYSLPLKQNSGTYNVVLTSRANNNNVQAYILNDPTDNVEYTLSKSVSSASSSSNVNIVAPATGTLEGAAFHILDQILNANIYLRTSTAGCSNSANTNYFPGCSTFTVAPLISVYWAKGVNPGTYVGSSSVISFYLLGKRQLYLVGGVNGDVDCSDTDHFDTSVIVHEYGHFIEDMYAIPDNPGGSHNGDSIIDPRLAWGEGWADFFQAAVTGNAFYRDTWGNADGPCPNHIFINYDIPNNNPALDVPVNAGEGNFHEFSITRALWNGLLTSGGDVLGFSEIWTTVTAPTGMKANTNHFRNVANFHRTQDALPGRHSWATVRSNEKQITTLTDYATPLVAGSCSATSIQGVKGSSDNGSFSTSNQFSSNDFYDFAVTSSGTYTITLTYDRSMTNAPDLDLYVYSEKYVYGNKNSMVASSANSPPPNGPDNGVESVAVGLDPGHYMINVQVYTGGSTAGAATTYSLKINNQLMCPNP